MDNVTKKRRSDIMSRIRGYDTCLEMRVRNKLKENGVFFRKVKKKYFGNPDIAIPTKKTVIFIDSCFWHGCEKHLRIPKSNVEFWNGKISRNKSRDRMVTNYYKKKNWTIVRIWEHDLHNKSVFNRKIKAVKNRLNY